MEAKKIEIDAFSIHGAENLDFIDVYIRMDSPQAGRITIQCWDQCWTAYWGSMGGTIRQFWRHASVGYLVENLQTKNITNKAVTRREYEYLCRIVLAVKEAIQQQENNKLEETL